MILPLRLLSCLVCLLLDVCVLAAYGVVLLFGIGATPWSVDPNKPTVVFLHGSGADDRQFLLAQGMLGNDYNIVTINLPKDDLTIDDYCAILSSLLPPSDIILVGVSMGGLCAAHLATYHKNVRGVVTIGSPWQGAPALNYLPAWTQRHKDMMPGSDFLTQQLTPPACPLLTFGSESDLHVPNEWSYPVAAHEHIRLLAPGHIALTVYPPIFRRIHTFIQSLQPLSDHVQAEADSAAPDRVGCSFGR